MMKAVEPLLRRKVFLSEEDAVREMTKDYVLHHVEQLRQTVSGMEDKYGMTFEQFDAYLAERARLFRSDELTAGERKALGKAIMREEDDHLDWKAAREMLMSWLGVQREAAV